MKVDLFATALLATAVPATAYIMPGSAEWSELESNGAFDNLMDSLSSPDILEKSIVGSWGQECAEPFEREGFPLLDTAITGLQNVSNYQLFEQPSGLCADHLSCAYAGCYWPFGENTEAETAEALATADLPEEDLLNLPAYVLHPQSVGDIISVVNFAEEHDIAIAVKASGHSYLGGSTSKGSILIHMSSFPKYTMEDWETALIECPTEQGIPEAVSARTSVVTDHICNLATARGVPAALRVGGGQVWDEVYRGLHQHNEQNMTSKYHIAGAAAGTVSAAGGWLSGGGLSGNAGMRMFGFGVDQILQLEMVLANGWHVRFGPSSWESVSDSPIPKTTEVQGECNLGSTSTDESLWDWQPCPADSEIVFSDLWYAARGGAAGYGVVTAAVYQLHDKPGKLHLLWNHGIPAEVRNSMSEEAIKSVTELWMNFLIDFFFDPEALGVSEIHSNSCGSPALAVSMDPFVAGSVYCHNSAGPVMLGAWTNTVMAANATLQELGVDASILVAVFTMIAEVEDAVENSFFWQYINPASGAGVPPGRMADYPKPGVLPSYYTSYWSAILPKSWLLDKERSIPFLYTYATSSPDAAKSFYVLGGRTALDHDQNNAISASQRDASFVIPIYDVGFAEHLLQELYGSVEGDDFPAGAEYNHAGVNEYGPLKEDWTKPCPMEWSRAEKDSKCISLQESVWGTSNLAKLTSIKNAVDPNNRFNCFGCVGYVDVHADSAASMKPIQLTESSDVDEGQQSEEPESVELSSGGSLAHQHQASVLGGAFLATLLYLLW